MESQKFINGIKESIEKESISIENLNIIENRLYENQKIITSNINKYYYLSILFLLSWFLLDNGIINELSVFEFNFKNKKIVLFILPILSTLCTYFCVENLSLYNIYDEVSRFIQYKKHININKNLLELLPIPSFLELLNLKFKTSKKNYITNLKLLIIIFSIILIPIFSTIFIILKLTTNYYNNITFLIINFIILLIYFKNAKKIFQIFKS